MAQLRHEQDQTALRFSEYDPRIHHNYKGAIDDLSLALGYACLEDYLHADADEIQSRLYDIVIDN